MIFVKPSYYRSYGVGIFSNWQITGCGVVENMERLTPDCKGRHKSIKLMRQGGALPPAIADYRLAATEPHTIERSRSWKQYNIRSDGYTQKTTQGCFGLSE